MFLTIEGGEGSGKSSLLATLAAHLTARGLPVVTTREPGGCQLAESVRDLLLHNDRPVDPPVDPRAETLLFLAARAQHLAEVIRPALDQGKIVLCDRWNDSTIAYQGYGRELGVDRITALCQLVSIEPDYTLLLNIDPTLGLQRAAKTGAADRMESETLAFHTRVNEGFRQPSKSHPNRIIPLDGSQSLDHVHQAAKKVVDQWIPQ